MSITVKEAMNIGGLKKARIIAGFNGIEKLIEHVSVIEVPESPEWFRGKELVLTAFYTIKNNEKAQLDLLQTIHDKNVSALGLCYPGMYYDTLSEEVLKLASELAIPIIEIPREVAYVEIISPIIETIQKKQSLEIHQALQIQGQLHEWLALQLDLESITLKIGESIQEDIIILDEQFQLLSSMFRGKNLNVSQISSIIDKYLKQRSQISNDFPFTRSTEEVRFYSYPIHTGDKTYGHLVVISRNENSSLKTLIFEYLSTSLALFFSQKAIIEETNRRHQKTLIDDWLIGNAISPEIFLERSSNLGWNMEGIIGLSVIKVFETDLPQDNVYSLIKSFLIKKHNESLPVIYGQNMLLFLKMPDGNAPSYELYYRSFFQDLCSFISEKNISNPHIVFSEKSENFIVNANDLYKEAMDVLSFQIEYPVLPNILYSPNVPLFSFLKEHSFNPSIIRLRNLLEPLERYDQQYQTNLVETLEYMLFTEDIQSLSKKLNIHRNTLNYRRQRIKEILVVNPFESLHRLQFELALLVRK
jgi:purine catabolism regulator